MEMNRNTAGELERIVDTYGLRAVLSELGAITDAKADHIRTNWQDGSLAKVWERAGRAVWRAADDPRVARLATGEGR